MRSVMIFLALGLLETAAANAGLTSTVTLTNDYDFRGLTQTVENPAAQVDGRYEYKSGWYIGVCASNVDFPGYNGDLELDLYTGFSGGSEDRLIWDAGLTWYTYPTPGGAAGYEIPNYPEIHASLGRGVFKGTIWYSNDFGGTDSASVYYEVSTTIKLPKSFAILAHFGFSDGDGIIALYGDSYSDYSLGAEYTAGQFKLTLKYVGQNINDRSLGLDDGRIIFNFETRLSRKTRGAETR